MEKQDKKIFNPFEGRNREQGWKEIRELALPTTREEALRQMKALSKRKE